MLLETKGPALKREFVIADCCVEGDVVRATTESRAFCTFPLFTVTSVCLKIDCYQIKGNRESVAISFSFFFFCLPPVVNLPALDLAAPNLPHTQQQPSVGPLSRCLVAWRTNEPENMEFFPLDSSIRSAVCSILCVQMHFGGKTNILFIITLHAFLSFAKHPRYNDNGRPLPTYKCHNQLDIPETAPFDLTLLSA